MERDVSTLAPPLAPLGVLAAARQQILVIGSAPHKIMLAFIVLGILQLFTAVNMRIDVPQFHAAVSGLLLVYFLSLVGAQIWAASIWHGESPSQRGYHWAMPVDRTLHDLLRVVAGAIWLTVVLLALLVIGTLIAPLFGAARSTTGLLDPLLLGFISGPLIVYFFCSVPGLRSDHPGRWILAAPICLLMVWGFATWWGLDPLSELMRALLIGKFGLFRTIGMPLVYPVIQVVEGAGEMETLFSWLGASAAWLTVAIAGVYLAASRRQGG